MLINLLNLSSWCLVMVERLFLTVPRGCLRFMIVVFPYHTHLLFLFLNEKGSYCTYRFIRGCHIQQLITPIVFVIERSCLQF